MTGRRGLYRPEFERDACGIGFVANKKSNQSHSIEGRQYNDYSLTIEHFPIIIWKACP